MAEIKMTVNATGAPIKFGTVGMRLPGIQGNEGKSAYQTWLDLGNTGTEAEYIASLKGDKGDPFVYSDFTPEQLAELKGEDGYTPVKGVDYFDGQDGAPGADGTNAVITGGASTITENNLTASRALVSNAEGKVGVSAVTDTELGYVSGVTSGIQGQINGKAQIVTIETTLSAASWANGQYTMSNGEITASSGGSIKIAHSASLTQHQAFNYANMIVISQYAGGVIIRADGYTPTIDIPVIIEVIK